MAVSGLVYAVMADGDVVWLRVRDGEVVDAPEYIKRRIVGGCPRRAWTELAKRATRIDWIPDDRRQRPVQRVPRRAATGALDRLRRAHQRLAPPAAA